MNNLDRQHLVFVPLCAGMVILGVAGLVPLKIALIAACSVLVLTIVEAIGLI